MNSARKIKLRLTQPRPRNPLVAAAAQRKAGKHRQAASGKRHAERMQLRDQLKELKP